MTHSYFVTGGAGFIGAHVVAQLVAAGRPVTSYDLRADSAFLREVVPSGVTCVQGDVLDLPRLLGAVQASKADTLIHLASPLSTVTESNPWLAVHAMVVAQVNVLESARLLDLRKIVWASSMGVWGPPHRYPEGQVFENSPHYPERLYGLCKSFDEGLSRHYRKQFGVVSVGLRYTAVYGPGRERGAALFMKDLVTRPVRGEVCRLPFADDPLNWLYVKDAATATVLCAETDVELPDAVNLSGEVATVRQAAAIVAELVPSASFELEGGSYGTPAEIEAPVIRERLGFQPQYSLRAGLAELVQWEREHARGVLA
ncbi:MAG: NAD(P)-dependent oxidoreductase [Chloroflexi bacterium]|nr:NAD(P)-dependent oxidoreductase [Chloroflexota bacterium]